MTATTMRAIAARLDPRLGKWSRQITITYAPDHARVELDRDNWMDRHRDAAEISPEFRAAADRCLDAGIWRIWLNGSNRSFQYGSGSDRWVTLFVPLHLVDEAVAALKSAELRADLSRLDRLTAKMAAPFDAWLAPGERYLQVGVDFTCTPKRFLAALRGKAKRLDLKLNGRVDGNGVWVRPERTAEHKFLREAFPERYGDAPDPYAAATPVSSERPPAPRRERSARARSTVRYLDAATLDGACPCGWGFDGAQHDQQHVRWSVGIPTPARLIFARPIAVVDTMAPKTWRSLAYECARLAQRDGQYDFASFTHPSSDPEPHEGNLRAYLLATPMHVVGYLSVTDTERNASWDFEPEAPLMYTDTVRRPQVGLIFVAKEWRRRGVAATLVRAMATDAGMTVSDVAWDPPFTPAGKALARSLSPNRIWIGS